MLHTISESVKQIPTFLAAGWHLILVTIIFHIYGPCIHGNTASKRLYNDLLHESGYNRHVRPVENEEDQLNVEISIKLAQIIDVVLGLICFLPKATYWISHIPSICYYIGLRYGIT